MGAPGAAARADDGPPERLDRSERGEAAVRALGDELANVAARHGMTAATLRATFRSDAVLWVDPTHRLFYLEPALGPSGSPSVEPAAAGSTDVFALHSRPGSSSVIFLDGC